jgi:hypothetical protein
VPTLGNAYPPTAVELKAAPGLRLITLLVKVPLAPMEAVPAVTLKGPLKFAAPLNVNVPVPALVMPNSPPLSLKSEAKSSFYALLSDFCDLRPRMWSATRSA